MCWLGLTTHASSLMHTRIDISQHVHVPMLIHCWYGVCMHGQCCFNECRQHLMPLNAQKWEQIKPCIKCDMTRRDPMHASLFSWNRYNWTHQSL